MSACTYCKDTLRLCAACFAADANCDCDASVEECYACGQHHAPPPPWAPKALREAYQAKITIRRPDFVSHFEFEGTSYSFLWKDYPEGGAIRLPDGRFLQPGWWLEVYPPIPTDLKEVPASTKYVVATQGSSPPASE